MAGDVVSLLTPLIADLRNRRNPETTFSTFQTLMDAHADDLLASVSLRWLVSMCDTYADYGTPIERRNALLVSLFVNLIRVSDTLRKAERREEIPAMIEVLKTTQLPLYDGLKTLSLAKQDTCLNLAKRLIRVLQETPFFLAVYQKAVRESLAHDSLLGTFARLSAHPERVFPEDALTMADNYGVI